MVYPSLVKYRDSGKDLDGIGNNLTKSFRDAANVIQITTYGASTLLIATLKAMTISITFVWSVAMRRTGWGKWMVYVGIVGLRHGISLTKRCSTLNVFGLNNATSDDGVVYFFQKRRCCL